MAISKRMVICCLNQITQNLAMEVHSTFCHLLQFCKGNANNLSFKTLKLFDEKSTTLLASLPNPPPPSSFPTVIVSLSDFFVYPSFLPALPRPVPPRPALLLPPHGYHHFYHYHHCQNHHPHIKSAPFSSSSLFQNVFSSSSSSWVSCRSSFFFGLFRSCPLFPLFSCSYPVLFGFSGERCKKRRMSQRHPRTRNGSFFLKITIFCEIALREESGGYFLVVCVFLPQIGASRSSSVLLGFPRFSSVFLGSPRFSSVLLGSPRSSSVLLGPPRVSPRCSPQFSSVLLGSREGNLFGSPRFSSVLSQFCSVLLGSALFSLVLLGAPRSSSVFSSVFLGGLGAKFAKNIAASDFLSEILQESRVWSYFPRSG